MGSVGESAFIDHNSESKGKLMSNLKTGLWIVILGFVVLLFFQNQDVFLAKRTLRMDLFFVKYQTPELPDVLLFICTFVLGYVISYMVNLSSRFKFKKLIKQLNSTLAAKEKELAGVKSEIDGLKAAAIESEKEPEKETEIAPNTETPMGLEDTVDRPKEQEDDEEKKPESELS